MQSYFFKLRAVIVVALPLIVVSCGQHHTTPGTASSSETSPPTLPGLHVQYDVTYTDQTIVIDRATVEQHLLGVSEDRTAFRFRPAAREVQHLRPGQIALFAGQALRKVVQVREAESEILVETQPATLNEAIRDGTIAWSGTIDWDDLPEESFNETAAALAALPQGPFIPAAGTSPFRLVAGEAGNKEVKLTGKVQGWDIDYKLKPATDRILIDLSASRSAGGKKYIAISAEGWISNFTQEAILTYEQSTPTNVTMKTTGLEGEMELKWAAFSLGQQAVTEVMAFQIPVKLPIPFTIGPIPMVLNLKASLQIVPHLLPPDASSGGSFKVKYNSDQGFAIQKASQQPYGTLNKSDIGVSGETGSAGHVAVGFSVGIEFPRLELALLGESAMAFVTIKTYSTSMFQPGTTLTNDVPPCQMGKTSLMAIAGYKLGALGLSLTGTQEIWKDNYVKYKDDRECDMVGGVK